MRVLEEERATMEGNEDSKLISVSAIWDLTRLSGYRFVRVETFLSCGSKFGLVPVPVVVLRELIDAHQIDLATPGNLIFVPIL